ncbi:MAG: hypothetical protein DHS20C15_09280 [Planctomycetota bacterium]|nr:MAG: hypothetical protein DHS20C15_09280 [Planctomycetota bacterium]
MRALPSAALLLSFTVSLASAWASDALAPAAHAAPAPKASALDVSDARHVRAVYLDTVGRTPREDELLLAERVGGPALIEALVGSPEYWENWYEEELYYFLLLDNLRPEDPGPRKRLSDRLAKGDLHVVDAVRGIASSSAFHRANPGNDTFVSVVLEQLLGLEVQRYTSQLEAGKRMYDGQRASLWGEEGRNQADVVRIAVGHEDFAPHFLSRQYTRLIGEQPDRRALKKDVARFADNPRVFVELVREWLLSPEYAERLGGLRPKSDRQFIRGIYVDLVDEPPDLATMQRYRTALAAVGDAGPLRSVIARVLLNKVGGGLPERGELPAEELVQGCFRRFFGRDPSADELEVIAGVYTQCECSPDMVVLSLVTHPEYQHY